MTTTAKIKNIKNMNRLKSNLLIFIRAILCKYQIKVRAATNTFSQFNIPTYTHTYILRQKLTITKKFYETHQTLTLLLINILTYIYTYPLDH